MGAEKVTTSWLSVHGPDDMLDEQIGDVVIAVVEQGGAVGWLTPPDRDEMRDWVAHWREDAEAGRADLLTVSVGGVVRAVGGWKRFGSAVMAHRIELVKVMVHPAARGLGLGRVLMTGLVEGASLPGVEVLTLDVRGNNHGAVALYESLGFEVWGALPDVIAVGNERFDSVAMYRPLGTPSGVIRRGRTPGGTGGSHRRS